MPDAPAAILRASQSSRRRLESASEVDPHLSFSKAFQRSADLTIARSLEDLQADFNVDRGLAEIAEAGFFGLEFKMGYGFLPVVAE
jgi:hypothetical protein